MTNQEIANYITGKTPQEIASICDEVFELVLAVTPENDHDSISLELENVGILIGHEENEITTSDGICKRKKAPNPR